MDPAMYTTAGLCYGCIVPQASQHHRGQGEVSKIFGTPNRAQLSKSYIYIFYDGPTLLRTVQPRDTVAPGEQCANLKPTRMTVQLLCIRYIVAF